MLEMNSWWTSLFYDLFVKIMPECWSFRGLLNLELINYLLKSHCVFPNHGLRLNFLNHWLDFLSDERTNFHNSNLMETCYKIVFKGTLMLFAIAIVGVIEW